MQNHPQIREIELALQVTNSPNIGLDGVAFTPVRADNTDKGIVSVICGVIRDSVTHSSERHEAKTEDVGKMYADFYRDKPFVRILSDSVQVETRKVVGTNYCHLKIMLEGKKIKVVSALDNILKGGAGQAIQNFNIMNGLDETAGLAAKH